MVIFRERYEGDAEKFESALKMAKKGIKEACEIFEDMKEEFGERGYGERYHSRNSREWEEDDDMQERRSSRRYR